MVAPYKQIGKGQLRIHGLIFPQPVMEQVAIADLNRLELGELWKGDHWAFHYTHSHVGLSSLNPKTFHWLHWPYWFCMRP